MSMIRAPQSLYSMSMIKTAKFGSQFHLKFIFWFMLNCLNSIKQTIILLSEKRKMHFTYDQQNLTIIHVQWDLVSLQIQILNDKKCWFANGLFIKWDLKSGQMEAILSKTIGNLDKIVWSSNGEDHGYSSTV